MTFLLHYCPAGRITFAFYPLVSPSDCSTETLTGIRSFSIQALERHMFSVTFAVRALQNAHVVFCIYYI